MAYHWTFSQDDAIKYGASLLLDLECLQRFFNKNLDDEDIAERFSAQEDEYYFDHTSHPDYECVDLVIDDWDDCIRETFYELTPIETNIAAPNSRHYDSKSVAMICCGHWVGWTEWSGGGKHGCPEEIDKDPHFLTVTDQRLVTITHYEFALLEVTP